MSNNLCISTAHLQLTGHCNLSCSFCGQSRGMLNSDSAADDFGMDFWLDVVEQAKQCACPGNEPLRVTLWGGEPLLYHDFEPLTRELHRRGVKLSIVTNGTMISRYADVLNQCLDVIYVSLDGPAELNDQVRGRGVFARVEQNLKLLEKRRGKLVFLTTVSDINVSRLAELPTAVAGLKPDAMVMGQLMYLSSAEIEEYRAYSKAVFGCDYAELSAWRRDDDREYLAELKKQLVKLNARIAAGDFPFPVRFTPHIYPDGALDAPACDSPSRRVHVRNDGEVGFCTDYFGFSIGNVKSAPLCELFAGPRAELWRKAAAEKRIPLCNHCPWRMQQCFRAFKQV